MSGADANEGPSFNTPVDDPHHYDFQTEAVPMNPDEQTPPGHEQHLGGYRNEESKVDQVVDGLVVEAREADRVRAEDSEQGS